LLVLVFTPRTLDVRLVPGDLLRVFLDGLRFGLRHPVVRPLMLANFVEGTFLIYGFYSWQPYFLAQLGRELLWVSGLVAALVGAATIAGNLLVAPLSRRLPSRTPLLVGAIAVQCATAVACGFLQSFYALVASYLVHSMALGLLMPLKQSYLNDHIPSEQRATLISLDSFFGSGGGALGQTAWGYLSRARSIAAAWVAGGAVLALGIPLYLAARRGEARASTAAVTAR
jgi:MFS family permease